MSSFSLLKNVPHIRKVESGGVKKKVDITQIMMIEMKQPSGIGFDQTWRDETNGVRVERDDFIVGEMRPCSSSMDETRS